MITWGAIWGAVLAVTLYGNGGQLAFVGAALGAIAGLTLRSAVRKEVERQRSSWLQAQESSMGAEAKEVPVARDDEAGTWETPAAVKATETEPAQRQPAVALDSSAAQRNTVFQTPSAPTSVIIETPRAPVFLAAALQTVRDWLFGGNTIVRMGVLVLFVGLAFLAKYAVEHSLLPPELRLAGIAVTGIALFGFGFWLRGNRPDRLGYALTMQGAGIAVLYLTVFSAFRLYQFLPAGMAFVMLGLICLFASVIALAQNAMPMAFIGFAGGFAAPILLSSDSGNHVGLFSYYLLLNVAIVVIAYWKAWRPLNLLGFFATFGVATAWGVLKYKPEHLSSTEPFLLAFFLIYVAASVLYATRHSLAAKQAVDATLIFGTPLIAFGLQAGLVRHSEFAMAFSALVLGAFYLALTWWMLRRKTLADDGRREPDEVGRWMGECFIALGLGFATLAVPLALDARWTSAAWAAEGAAVFWMGKRQARWLARAAGLALQLFAAFAYLGSLGFGPDPQWPLANPVFIGAALLGASALAIAHWARLPGPAVIGVVANAFVRIEQALSPLLFWVGFFWCQFALNSEITRAPRNGEGLAVPLFGTALQTHLHMLGWLFAALVAHRASLTGATRPWPIAATPSWLNLPVLLLAAVYGMLESVHVLQSWGWVAWPIALVLHGIMLRRLDNGTPQAWWPWVHAGGVWLMVLLLGNMLVFAIGQLELWRSAWATVLLQVAGTAVLLLISQRRWFDLHDSGVAAWPIDRFASAYLWLACAPLAVCVALGSLLVGLNSDGNAKPLPYLPLANPTDLSIALGLCACALWLLRLRTCTLVVPAVMRGPHLLMVLAAIAFVCINTAWLRVAHHYAGVPWNARQLFDSFLVQAGNSIVWTTLALVVMVIAHRRLSRPLWSVGAVLLAATVAKLFLIDLSNRGGSERIVVFIAVGALMLLVGYFAPIPPVAEAAPDAEGAPEQEKVEA